MEVFDLMELVAHLISAPFKAAAERRRHRELTAQWGAWTKERDWTFREFWPEMLARFTSVPFGIGGDRRAVFGYEGTFDGVEVQGFSHEYSMGSGLEKEIIRHHVSLVRTPGAQFPKLTITPETWATRVLGRDVQFEDGEFNKRWFVTSDAPRFAHGVVHPRMMEWLTSDLLPRSATVSFEGDGMFIATPGVLEPSEVDEQMRLLTRTLSTVPRFVLRDVGRDD